MKIEFYNKQTGKLILPSLPDADLILLNGKLYEVEFSSTDSLDGGHIYNGEGWSIDVEFEIKIIDA